MTQNTDVTAARDQLLADFNKVVSDTDVLLRSLVGVGGEKARAVRESVEMNLASTRERMRQLQASATEKTAAARKRFRMSRTMESIDMAPCPPCPITSSEVATAAACAE